VIGGPINPFLPEEKDALRAYLDSGGKLLLLMDPSLPNRPNNTDIGELLSKWEVEFTSKLVIEPAKALQGDPTLPVADSYASHPTTQDLQFLTFYPTATNINSPASGAGGATITNIVQTTDRSFSTGNVQALQQRGTLQPADDDQRGPLNLVAAIEQPVGPPPQQGQTQRSTRVYLIGSASFAANTATNTPAGNTDLFLNAINWLAEQEDLVSIRPPVSESRTMLLTGTQLQLAQWTAALFLPLAVLAVGAAVWWTRR
jgi:ABC-type uncharacterized transport system involved in gliding motility auxiliary subunit